MPDIFTMQEEKFNVADTFGFLAHGQLAGSKWETE